MPDFTTLEADVSGVIAQQNPTAAELRRILLEIEEIIASPEYEDLNTEERNKLSTWRRDSRNLLRQIAERNQTSNEDGNQLNQPTDSESAPPTKATGRQKAQPRNPQAEQQMEDGEKLFYSGRYSEAIKYFDRVLQLEPNWERARQHRAEAENYLRTGYIPPVALPSEAGSSFGKAQSAARVGRYADALVLLQKAQSVLRDLGIQRWQEGLEFEQKLQENIDAEYAFNEGLQLFENGRVDEAIERVETAARATGLPRYNDRATQYRKVREHIRSINEILSSPTLDPKEVAQAKADLDLMTAEYGENPAFLRTRARLENVLPRAIAPLQEQARTLKAQAQRATTLDEALYLARQSRAQLDQIRNLASLDENLDRLQVEIDRQIQQVTEYEDQIAQANKSYENHRQWPSQAARISQEVRKRYPNDPGVLRINHTLGSYFFLRSLLKLGILLLILAILFLLSYLGFQRFQSYLVSLTPTTTATFTQTATSTSTATSTFTPTITPTATSTYTPTPTPSTGVTQRDIWARNGCYEGQTAIGRIPAGGVVNFLQTERRFDTFNRECVLVEYKFDDKSTIGWILLIDLGSLPASTPTPQK